LAADLLSGLKKSRSALAGKLGKLFSSGRVDAEVMAEAEGVLLGADLGWELTEKILDKLPGRIRKADGDWRAALSGILFESLPMRTATEITARPEVIVVVGVNGAGKTTTIARLADRHLRSGQKVLLACADTFRAAAAEQLEVWAERLGVPVLTQLPGSDPGAVAFDAVTRAVTRSFDTVLIDTAGRLPNKKGLMAELTKVYRVCGKAMPNAPHRVLLVLDGTVGQNAYAQAEQFMEAIPVTGLVVTKLDGTAKGGSVLAMASRLGLPVEYIGVGESSGDLIDFEPGTFIEALLDIRGLEDGCSGSPA
jgi:fused signal recognition particle receptor